MKDLINKYIELIINKQGELSQYEFNFLLEMNVGNYLIAYISLETIENNYITYQIEDAYFIPHNIVEDLGFLCAMSTNNIYLLDIIMPAIRGFFSGVDDSAIKEAALHVMDTFTTEKD